MKFLLSYLIGYVIFYVTWWKWNITCVGFNNELRVFGRILNTDDPRHYSSIDDITLNNEQTLVWSALWPFICAFHIGKYTAYVLLDVVSLIPIIISTCIHEPKYDLFPCLRNHFERIQARKQSVIDRQQQVTDELEKQLDAILEEHEIEQIPIQYINFPSKQFSRY